jgi:uncharacterized protein (TIGR02996 family)
VKLSAAEDALRESKPEVALQALLELWRDLRHPRLSELIQRVSDQLTTSKGPLAEKSVGKQLNAALALHLKRDPAELGRLLRVRWPGTWQKGVPLLDVMLGWPDDPRIEAAVAALLAEPPWESLASWGFFSRLRPMIERFTDPRIIPALEAAQSRAHPWWYDRDFRPHVDAAITRLRAARPSLDAPTLEALERVEAHFSESKSREQDKSRGEAELLAAIYARPDDVQARAVFADWLTERDDPRGELITLQLSATRTRAQDTRLNALLEAHGSDWAGPLDEWFDKDVRFLEAGFLTGGLLVERTPRPFAEAAKVPGWKLVKTLEFNRWSPDPSALFAVCPLEALHGVEAALFTDLALGKPRALKELTLGRWVFDRGVPTELDGELPGLPKLETLGLWLNESTLAWIKRARVFKHLRRLRVTNDRARTELLSFVRASLPNILEIEVLNTRPDSWLAPAGWRSTVSRRIPGEYTELSLAWTAGRHRFDAFDLVPQLRIVDPSKVRKLEVLAGRTIKLKVSELADVEKALAEFTNATIAVPWERTAAHKPKKKGRTGPMLRLSLSGETLLKPPMEPLWKQLQALGLQFDSYTIGYGSAHRELGPKPVTTLDKWARNARCHEFKLYEDGSEESLRLERTRHGTDASTRLEFHWSEREVAPFLDWLQTLLDGSNFHSGTVSLGDASVPELISDSGPPGGWLTIFGGTQLAFLPDKELKALTTRFPGSFVRKTKRNLILSAAATPLETQPLARLGQELNVLVVDAFTRTQGVDFLELTRTTLEGPARALGLEPIEDSNERGARRVRFRHGDFTLVASVSGFLSTPRVAITLRTGKDGDGSYWSHGLAHGPFDPKTLRVLLAEAVSTLERDATRFMKDPANFFKKRK